MRAARSRVALSVFAILGLLSVAAYAQVKPGDVIGKDNADKIKDLVSPGNLSLVRQGMQIDVVPTDKLDWRPPYKSATEKYSPQVQLAPDGTLKNYVAGQPFPLLDPNDPQLATKIMWDFSFRPMYSDDADLRYPEIASYAPNATGDPAGFFTVGHFAFYNNIGRIEVPPVPTDPDYQASGLRYRFGFYPFLEPSLLRGFGLIRLRHMDPTIEDNTWVYNPQTRRLRRESISVLTDSITMLPGFSAGGGGAVGAGASDSAPYTSTLDPDSYFGFAAKIEDYNYRFLGEKQMLACVHAKNSPEIACRNDGGRTICPENWEMRHLYVVEGDAKPGYNFTIPKRILYIDSEGWFITASDQYDHEGKLWKTIATFQTYRDRPVPDATVAIYPYKRIFQLGLADEDLQTGASSVVYMPGPQSPERECWYIDMGTIDNSFFAPDKIEAAGH